MQGGVEVVVNAVDVGPVHDERGGYFQVGLEVLGRGSCGGRSRGGRRSIQGQPLLAQASANV